jgi:HAMP domain-containing protein
MAEPDKPKRRIRNFLLDKRFQLKYTLAVVAVSAMISAGLGYFLYQAHLNIHKAHEEIYQAQKESSTLVMLNSLGDSELENELAEVLTKGDDDIRAKYEALRTGEGSVLLYLMLFLGGLVLCLGAVGIVATHKIAGPAYAMRRTMSQIADGEFPRVRALRKRDELQSVRNELKRMADNLREREENELKVLKAALESKSTPEQIEELIRLKEKRLAS